MYIPKNYTVEEFISKKCNENIKSFAIPTIIDFDKQRILSMSDIWQLKNTPSIIKHYY